MPIIEGVDPDEGFTQGDIFVAVPLFATGEDGTATSQGECDCILLSRPCKSVRAENLTVCKIFQLQEQKAPKKPPGLKFLKEVITGLRDGQDIGYFYLGQLPDRRGRFAANFAEVYTVHRNCLRGNRVGRLTPAFAKDLHLQLFRSFASLGFSDFTWWSDEDLKCLVVAGEAEVKHTEAEIASLGAAVSYAEASGNDRPDLGDLDGKLAKQQREVEQYRKELNRRGL